MANIQYIHRSYQYMTLLTLCLLRGPTLIRFSDPLPLALIRNFAVY